MSTPSTLVREGPGADGPSSELDVQVVPRASRSRIVGPHDGRLKIQLAAPPVDGAANEALVELLAETLELPRSAVSVLRGATGKRKTLRIAGLGAADLRARLGLVAALLLLAPACENSQDFPIKVIMPEDLDLARADNAVLRLSPQNIDIPYDISGADFNLELSLEPDDLTSTLTLYLAQGPDLLAWGTSAPFVLSAPPAELALYVSPPGALSTFPGTITSPDPAVLACPAFGRGMLLFNSDGGTGLFNSFNLATEIGATLKPEGGLPDASDGALVGDSAGGVWRIAWAEQLRAFRYEPGDDQWTTATFADPSPATSPRPGAAHLQSADLDRLLVFGGGEQRTVIELDLAPDDSDDHVVTTLPQQLDSPRRGATALFLLRTDSDAGEGVVLVGGDDETTSLAHFVPADVDAPLESFGPPQAWTGLACAQLDRGDAATATDAVRVLCLGGLRSGVATRDAIVLNFPPPAANLVASLELLPDFLPEPASDPRLFSEDAAIYAQSGVQWSRIDRAALTVESSISASTRVRGGHSVLLATGATFLVGGWAQDERAVDHWHVFVPTLASP